MFHLAVPSGSLGTPGLLDKNNHNVRGNIFCMYSRCCVCVCVLHTAPKQTPWPDLHAKINKHKKYTKEGNIFG